MDTDLRLGIRLRASVIRCIHHSAAMKRRSLDEDALQPESSATVWTKIAEQGQFQGQNSISTVYEEDPSQHSGSLIPLCLHKPDRIWVEQREQVELPGIDIRSLLHADTLPALRLRCRTVVARVLISGSHYNRMLAVLINDEFGAAEALADPTLKLELISKRPHAGEVGQGARGGHRPIGRTVPPCLFSNQSNALQEASGQPTNLPETILYLVR